MKSAEFISNHPRHTKQNQNIFKLQKKYEQPQIVLFSLGYILHKMISYEEFLQKLTFI